MLWRHRRCWSRPIQWVFVRSAGTVPETVKPFSAIPGPKPLPILGNLLETRRNSKSLGLRLYADKCLKEYGGIYRLRFPGGRNLVFISDPHMLEAVLRAEGKYPNRNVTIGNGMTWFYTHQDLPVPMAFASNEEWKELRTAVGKQTLPRNVNSYIPGMNDVLQRFTRYLRASRDEKGYVEDISELMNKLLMELSAGFVYNKDLKVVESPDEDAITFIHAVKTILGGVQRLAIEPPVHKIFSTKYYRSMAGAIKALYNLGRKYAEEQSDHKTKGLLQQWLEEKRLTKEQAIIQSIDNFAAGIDTTANGATFMLHAIATHPEVQERLHAEISSVLGDSRLPTAEDLAAMPYVKGCVRETLRYYVVIPFNTRTLKEDMVLMGYHVPAKTVIMYALHTSGRSEKCFKNPEKFDPDRWNNDDISAFALLPFGFGPRACYGRRFAELEMKLLLIEMTRNFNLRRDQQELPMLDTTIIRAAGKVPLQLIDRN